LFKNSCAGYLQYEFLIMKNNSKYNALVSLSLAVLAGSSLFTSAYGQVRVEKRLSVAEMFALADSNSTQIRLSEEGINEAAARFEEAKANKLPSLKFSATAGYLGNAEVISYEDPLPSGSYEMPHFSNSFGLEASYVIYAGGALTKLVDLAGFQKNIASLNYEKDKMDVRLYLVANYIDLYVAQNHKKVYEKNIEQTQKLLDMMVNRLAKGVALRSDILRTQLQLSNYTFGLSKIENRISILNKRLVETLALSEGTQLIAEEIGVQREINELETSSLGSNVELRQADVKVSIAQKGVEISKAKNSPVFSLYASSNMSRPFVYDLPPLDLYANIWTAGMSLTYNIDGLFKNTKAIKRAKTQLSESKLSQKLTREHVELDYHENIVNCTESREQLKVAKKDLELATDNYNLVVNRYNTQLALITDLMDASASKLRAELQLQNARAAIAFAVYKVQRILGNL